MVTEIKQTCKLQRNKYNSSTPFHDWNYERKYEGNLFLTD